MPELVAPPLVVDIDTPTPPVAMFLAFVSDNRIGEREVFQPDEAGVDFGGGMVFPRR